MFFKENNSKEWLKRQWFGYIIVAIIANYFIMYEKYLFLILPLLLLIGIAFFQKQSYLIVIILLLSIAHILIIKLYGRTDLNTNMINSFKVKNVGKGYYFVSSGWQLFYLKSNQVFNLFDEIKIEGYFSNILENPNKYEFDTKTWLNSNGIFSQLNITKTLNINRSESWYQKINLYFSSENDVQNSFLRLIVFGEQNVTTSSLYNNFAQLGVIHLLIISGYHINILFFILNKGCARVFKSKVYIFIICMFLLFYLYLLNFSLTSIKAFNFLLLGLINKQFFQKKFSTNQIWCLNVLFILVFFPTSFLKPGFIYGFIITLVLINLSKVTKHLKLWKKIIVYNLFIYFVILGINIYFNYTINFLIMFYNILLTPILVSIYLLSFFVSFIKPFYFFYDYCYFFIFNYSALLLKINLVWYTGEIPIYWLIFYYVFFLMVVYYSKKIKKIAFICFSCTCFLLFFFSTFVQHRYSLTMLNVGNGQTIVLQDQWNFKVIIYDIGVGAQRSKQLVKNYLKWRGVNWINAIFISHQHQDHYNNLEDVKNNFYVHKSIYNYNVENTYNFGQFNFTILNKHYNFKDENDNSIVLLIKIDGIKILLTGDSTKKVEDKINNWDLPKIDFLQVAHHGSNTSTSLRFLEKIEPKTCFISGTKDHQQNFPHPDVLIRLEKIKCQIYTTRTAGNLQYSIINNNYQIKSF